jgi:hypothetical protein
VKTRRPTEGWLDRHNSLGKDAKSTIKVARREPGVELLDVFE